ncbi:MAG: ribonuclease III domain-containing protein [Vampirovibrionales bacterium]
MQPVLPAQHDVVMPSFDSVAQLPVKLLAYIGDGVYELWARYAVLEGLSEEIPYHGKGLPWEALTTLTNQDVQGIHRRVTQFTQGSFQAHILSVLLNVPTTTTLAEKASPSGLQNPLVPTWSLTEEERALVKRFLNTHHKGTRHKKHDQTSVRQATALEALIGYWHMKGYHQRLYGFWSWVKCYTQTVKGLES